ncbi:hypothetical protein XM53_02095 [Roseovarius atlanticus]|uniref:Uncharacterized protein n=1 Tax=Roseovarius atlanticus TaxID=1641875 RepID=A0A0T5P0C6_9RHOB|nr:hypothetical protein [Roseovarius atlanticus]KRS14529.1 hypothetical protein XM53_02095 [Roseovarius atlanticus]
MTDFSDFEKLRTPDGGWVGPEELHQVLAEDGYSVGNREQYLKTLLTRLSKAECRTSNDRESHLALMQEVRNILSQEQDKEGQNPISDDV